MLTFEAARERIVSAATPVGTERVALDDADGRVLREDVTALVSTPPFAASAMDGYAVRAADLASGRLEVAGESAAGSAPATLAPGTAMRIFTGAPLPLGADAVVIQENVERDGAFLVTSDRPPPGRHVRRPGEDVAAGALCLAAGVRLGPAKLALLATADRADVVVSRRVRVAVLATGDELRDPGSPARPGSIPESNGVGLAALARRLGAEVLRLPRSGDSPAETEARIRSALDACDVLLTVGGVSVGDHDVVRPALEAAGVAIDFWKVSIKPGKPLCVGRRGETWVLGLPGNPVSALVTMTLFGAPLLRALAGETRAFPAMERARLSRDVGHQPGRTEFLRCTLARGTAQLADRQSSSAILGMAEADALAVVPLDANDLPAGTEVDVLRLADV